MDWLSQNWVWVLIGVAFVVMHMFGHGGHGGHGSHGGHSGHGGGCGGGKSARDPEGRPDEDASPAHRH